MIGEIWLFLFVTGKQNTGPVIFLDKNFFYIWVCAEDILVTIQAFVLY